MRAVEFTTTLSDEPRLTIPREVAAQLPKQGMARVIVLTRESPADADEAEWRLAAYEQFVREDAPEDAVYDNVR